MQYIEREVQRRPDFIPHASSLFEISGDDVYYAALNRFDVVLNTNEIFEIKRQLDLDKAATAALVFDGDLDEKSWAAIENIAEQLLTAIQDFRK